MLVLNSMEFSERERGWPLSSSFVNVVKSMKTIQRLHLLKHNLADENVSCMLGGLPDLRSLGLSSSHNTLSDRTLELSLIAVLGCEFWVYAVKGICPYLE